MTNATRLMQAVTDLDEHTQASEKVFSNLIKPNAAIKFLMDTAEDADSADRMEDAGKLRMSAVLIGILQTDLEHVKKDEARHYENAERMTNQRNELLAALEAAERIAQSIKAAQARLARDKGTPDEEATFDRLRGCKEHILDFFESPMFKAAIANASPEKVQS